MTSAISMRRTTRSQSRQASVAPAPTIVLSLGPIRFKTTPNPPNISFTLSSTFTPKLTGLGSSSTTLLRHKRSQLQASIKRSRCTFRFVTRTSQEHFLRSLDATLVFAQEEAGTAVCISPTGLLLTCSHCVADDMENALNSAHWLIFATGVVVKAVCVAFDVKRDLALLQITDSEPLSLPSFASSTNSPNPYVFPYAAISSPMNMALGRPLFCIGHPGSEDLEASTSGQATGYNVLHISEGKYHGLSPNQDPQDNSEIGALMHDCWTYWGHSGGPLLDRKTAALVGLHSSWDDQTCMRRGVPLEAITTFLEEQTSFGAVETPCEAANGN